MSSNVKLTNAQQDLILHMFNGDGKITDDFSGIGPMTPPMFRSADGSQEFKVNDLTIELLLEMGIFTVSCYRTKDVYRLSKMAQQLIGLGLEV